MRLWVETEAVDTAGRKVKAKLSEMTKDISRQVVSRATRAVNELRNAELDVLKGKRSGHIYRKYPYKTHYQASKAGEPPARRTGALRLHWNGKVETRPAGSGSTEVTAILESGEEYAAPLEYGSTYSKRAHYTMAPRPFHDRIVEKALPNILRIYEASYE